MVSWVDALKKALFTVGFGLAFSLIGIIIIVYGNMTGITIVEEYPYVELNYLILVLCNFFGGLIVVVGSLTSFYKNYTEFLQAEIGQRGGGGPPPTGAKICPNCGTQNRVQARICRNCGFHLP